MQYTIKAKPTRYKGIQFRSRLEARWAAFFDKLGWQWEYEPCDFNGWYPDFVIFGQGPIYVEVKPVIEFPEDVADKMMKSISTQKSHWLLIVGQKPFISPSAWGKPLFENINIGWANRFFAKYESSHCSSAHYCSGKNWQSDIPTPFLIREKPAWDFGNTLLDADGAVYGYKSLPFESAGSDLCSRLIGCIEKIWGDAHKETRFEKGDK